MHRRSLNHLITPILAVLTSLCIAPLHAQQTIQSTVDNAQIDNAQIDHAQIFTLASDPVPTGHADSLSAPSTDSAVSKTSSSADQSQPAAQTDVQAPQPQTANPGDQQTTRILGILPNFRSVNADVKLPPESVKEKFVTASEDSFDYSSIFIPLAIAGWSLHENSVPEFGGGGVGFGRYLWHAVVDQTTENFFVEAIVPSITHEDNRYYTLGHGGFIKRTGYALSRAVVTRSDSGREVFNASEVFGAGASAGISNLYYPTAERSFSNTGSQWGLDIGIDAASFVVKEFWPDINHYLFHAAKPASTPSH